MKNKFIISLFAVIMLTVCMSVPACAADIEYSSYTYDTEGESVSAPEAFRFAEKISIESLGISVSKITDMTIDSDGNIYMVDNALAKIIKLNSDNTLNKVVTKLSNGDKLISPFGISVGLDGNVYVADKEAGRILKMTTNLELIDVFSAPGKQEAQYDYVYKPLYVEADFDGRVYVIAENQTQGIFQFNKEGKFLGYYGAAKVIPSATELFFRKFASKEQLKGMIRFVPTEYSNMHIDKDGFMYCTVSTYSASEIQNAIKNASSSVTPVRRLNQGGSDILLRQGVYNVVGDIEFKYDYNDSISGASTFVDIVDCENGIYSVLDSRRGRIFTYNGTGELLYITGSRGTDKGQFISPSALLYRGTDLLVLDSADSSITVFNQTEYAKYIVLATKQYQAGEYDDECKTWNELLDRFPRSTVALTGIGRSYYNDGDYATALKYYRQAENREYYSKALSKYIQVKASKVFKVLFPVVAALVVIWLIIKLLLKKGIIKFKKHKSQFAERHIKLHKLGTEVLYSKYVAFHPFDGFWDLKHEKRGSVASATCILGLAVVANIIRIRWMPFLFNNKDFTETSAIYEGIMNIIALVALWCVSNWCITTLSDGKGTFRDIYIYTCYALAPIIVIFPLITLISYVLYIESATMLSIIIYLAVVWVGFLVIAGTISTHHYSFSKAVLAIILTILGMMIIVFLGLLVFSILQQIWQFFQLLFNEISSRR